MYPWMSLRIASSDAIIPLAVVEPNTRNDHRAGEQPYLLYFRGVLLLIGADLPGSPH